MSEQTELFAVERPKRSTPPSRGADVLADGFDIEEFVENFATLAEAEGGGEKLRGLVLDLVVRGRLLHESPLTPEETPQTAGLSVPFGLPKGWAWRRVDEAGELKLGRQRSPKNHTGPNMRPYLRVANVHEARIDTSDVLEMNFDPAEAERFLLKPNDVLLNEGQSYELVGRPAIYRGEVEGACFQNTLIRFRPGKSVLSEFALAVFRAYMRTGRFRREAQQTTNIAHLSLGRLAEIEFPLPPLAEQKRIVAKVDQLMALSDDLEARQTKKREVGARLTKSALEALTSAKGPEEFEAAWIRVGENFPTIIDRAEKVAELRGAILSLALTGKLTPQEPNANALAEVLAHKRSAVAVPVEEHPLELPKHWCWLRLEQLLAVVTDGDHQPPPQVPTGVSFLTIGNVSSGTINFDGSRFVPKEYFDKLDRRRVPEEGDILYTVVGASYGRPVLVETDRPFCVQRHIAILKPDSSCARDYLFLFLRSPLAYRQATASITGTAQPTVALRPLRRFLVPVPPREEQQRIVTKVEQLMTICDELEARLRQAEDRAAKLVAAAVQELVA